MKIATFRRLTTCIGSPLKYNGNLPFQSLVYFHLKTNNVADPGGRYSELHVFVHLWFQRDGLRVHPDGHEREQLHRQDPEEPTQPVESEAQQDQIKSQVGPNQFWRTKVLYFQPWKLDVSVWEWHYETKLSSGDQSQRRNRKIRGNFVVTLFKGTVSKMLSMIF